jgi:methyl-accepting chemotaxis protein
MLAFSASLHHGIVHGSMRQLFQANISLQRVSNMNFANLKIGTRLGMGFAGLLLLLTLMVGISVGRMSSLNGNVVNMADTQLPKVLVSTEWIVSILQTARQTRNMLLLEDPEKIKAEIAGVMEAKEKRLAYMKQLEQAITSTAGKAALQNVVAARTAYVTHEDAYLKLIAAGDMAAAKTLLLDQIRPTQLAYINALYKLVDFQSDLVKAAAGEAQADYSDGRNLVLALLAAALLLGSGYAVFVTRSITRPLHEAVDIAETVAAGDLTSRIEVNSADETGRLMQALKNMNDNLINIVGQVQQGTATIASASSQIASGNQDLSSRTEQQASSLEETASSMEELTSTVKQNADNARQANSLATLASEVAVKGGTVVAEVVGTMGSINESAKKIVDIIGVIDGIAFQTNILALNAAVEAARAGEQGRGFAVVATEVRNLAQRSAAAAKEIKELIGDSVEKVDAGSKLVDQAGATMQEIVASITRVTDIMGEITAASQEQSAGIEQVNQAITQMDDVTQQNASLVEEAAAAAESLQEQADQLVRVVGAFKLDEVPAAAAVQRPPARTATPRLPKVPAPRSPRQAPAQAKLAAQGNSASQPDEFEMF